MTQVTTFNGLTENDLLAVAAGADQGLNHPLAAALVREAERRGLNLPRPVKTEYRVGLGVEARLEGGDRYLVGNREFPA